MLTIITLAMSNATPRVARNKLKCFNFAENSASTIPEAQLLMRGCTKMEGVAGVTNRRAVARPSEAAWRQRR